MGCDIHLYIEYKVGNAPWFADRHHKPLSNTTSCLRDAYYTGRNYDLFNLLAQVRGTYSSPLGIRPKGYPPDASSVLVKDSIEFDGHSHSYLSLTDFKKVIKKAGYKLNKTDRPIAFYKERIIGDLTDYDYPNTIAYCESEKAKLKTDIEVEQMLLNQKINTKVQVRLLFYFDS